jgi:predicted aspartyl protease
MITGFFAPMREGSPKPIWSPMLLVSLGNGLDPGIKLIVETGVLALADTGADVCYIDIELAQRLKLLELGSSKNYSAAGVVTSPIFGGQIVLSDGSMLQMAMVGSYMQKNGFRHRVLLGMEALHHFRMVVTRKTDKFSLAWHAQ